MYKTKICNFNQNFTHKFFYTKAYILITKLSFYNFDKIFLILTLLFLEFYFYNKYLIQVFIAKIINKFFLK